jgi:hypothetical protein
VPPKTFELCPNILLIAQKNLWLRGNFDGCAEILLIARKFCFGPHKHFAAPQFYFGCPEFFLLPRKLFVSPQKLFWIMRGFFVPNYFWSAGVP